MASVCTGNSEALSARMTKLPSGNVKPEKACVDAYSM